ncbi:hypothetical protein [Neisseria dumasiana]|nr:hypothetical protein [Neisseria dumasiana]
MLISYLLLNVLIAPEIVFQTAFLLFRKGRLNLKRIVGKHYDDTP